ncbi:MAG: TonB-dependent receptor [Bacteroidetes bacterium]|nr:TonB-dependent receptor [Bacteroidota bacterium]
MPRQLLETDQKALEMNLDDSIYGAFAEIGAGQEVARYFFQVGAAAGTIAKTMSAYDKVVSDDIYGMEATGRYVCESRLYKMLDHEYDLMERRLRHERPDTNFFVFADTVAAINYQKTIPGDGWLGLRFQLNPDAEPNDIVLHVKMLDNDNRLQQQAVGILGVNLIYGCFTHHDDPETLLISLMDGLQGRVMVDLVRMTGPAFEELDNRLLSLWIIKNGLSKVAMFGPDKRNVHASEFLYKKNVLIVRGSFRPATLVNMDMIRVANEQFRKEPEVESRRTFLLTEITLDNLCAVGELDEQDFLDRAELLSALGQTVVVTNCEKYSQLINYLADFKVQQLGLVIGVRELLELISEKYYQNLNGRLLMAMGEIFRQDVRMYVYPAYQEGSEELMTSTNVPIPEGVIFLYKHLLDNNQIVDLQGFKPEILHIFSKEVLEMLRQDQSGWEDMVPPKVADLIREKALFGFPIQKMEFEY